MTDDQCRGAPPPGVTPATRAGSVLTEYDGRDRSAPRIRRRSEKNPVLEQQNSDNEEKEKAALAIMELCQQKKGPRRKALSKECTKTYQRIEKRKRYRDEKSIPVTTRCPGGRHHSVVSVVGDLFPLISSCKRQDCDCGLLHCPLCEKDFYKPVRYKSTLWRHVETHYKYSVRFEHASCCLCRLYCGGCLQSHYHCPLCFQRICRRANFITHLRTHEADYGQTFRIETRDGPVPESSAHEPCSGIVLVPPAFEAVEAESNVEETVIVDTSPDSIVEVDEVSGENAPSSASTNEPLTAPGQVSGFTETSEAAQTTQVLVDNESSTISQAEQSRQIILQTENGPVYIILEERPDLDEASAGVENDNVHVEYRTIASDDTEFVQSSNEIIVCGSSGDVQSTGAIQSEVIFEVKSSEEDESATVHTESIAETHSETMNPETGAIVNEVELLKTDPVVTTPEQSSERFMEGLIMSSSIAGSADKSDVLIVVDLSSANVESVLPEQGEGCTEMSSSSQEVDTTSPEVPASDDDAEDLSDLESIGEPAHTSLAPPKKKPSITIKDLNELERYALENYFSENKNEPFEVQVRQNEAGGVEYPCRLCDIVKSSRHAIYRHYRRDHCEKRFMCTKCPVRYAQFTDLKRHLKTCKGPAPAISNSTDSLQCSICQIKCKTRKTLRTHYREFHGKRPDVEFECPICSKIFPKRRYLMAHMARHNATRDHKCETCGKSFKLLSHLKEHQLVHRKEDRKEKFKCETCGKCFMRINALVDHMNLHVDKKPHACSACTKRFAGRCALAKHFKSVHSEERPHVCEVCLHGFKFKHLLRAHMKLHADGSTHSSEFYYQCSVCDETFDEYNEVLEHMAIHDTETVATEYLQGEDVCDGGEISLTQPNDNNESPDVSQYLKQISPKKNQILSQSGSQNC